MRQCISSYLQILYDRVVLMMDILKDAGTIYVQVEPAISPSVRLLMDEVFGSGLNHYRA